MANTIKIKRGLSSNISNVTLEQGELAITTDTNELYVGTESGNTKLNESSLKNIVDGSSSGSIRTINSRAEDSTYTLGKNAFAEGSETEASGDCSHAEGATAIASGIVSHAEGAETTASGDWSHAEGYGTTASGSSSHAEGELTTASGDYSHAEGDSTTASGYYSHAEGFYTIASGSISHAEGKFNIEDTENKYTHIVGNGTNDKRSNAHTLDWSGNAWFAGDVYVGSTSGKNKDNGSVKLAKITEVPTNLVNGKAEGSIRSIDAYDYSGSPLGKHAQAFGSYTTASGENSHAEGYGADALGNSSHAEGYVAKASGENSHAEGYRTIASGENQHVQGKYNIADTTSAHIIGNGPAEDSKSNAHTIDWHGNAWFAGDVYIKSTSGTNKDEGSKKLATEEFVATQIENSNSVAYCRMQINGIETISTEGKTMTSFINPVNYGGFIANKDNGYLFIPKGTKTIETCGMICGKGYFSARLEIKDADGAYLSTYNYTSGSILTQPSGNGYTATALPTSIIELDETKDWYIYIRVAGYTQNFLINEGFGQSSCWFGAKKIR